jgi:hypothetical protein
MARREPQSRQRRNKMNLREVSIFTIPERGPEIYIQLLCEDGGEDLDIIFPILAEGGCSKYVAWAVKDRDDSVPTATILPTVVVRGQITGFNLFPRPSRGWLGALRQPKRNRAVLGEEIGKSVVISLPPTKWAFPPWVEVFWK